MKSFIIVAIVIFAITGLMFLMMAAERNVGANSSPAAVIMEENGAYTLAVSEMGIIRRSENLISNASVLTMADSKTQVVTWNENDVPFYAISLDGQSIAKTTQAEYELLLRYGKFDPLRSLPPILERLSAREINGEKSFIVQFKTQPLEEYHAQLAAFGAKIFIYLPNYAYIVLMNEETRGNVAGLPFVRWVGRYQPAFKLEEYLLERMGGDLNAMAPARYNIMALDRGTEMQNGIERTIQIVGGRVDLKIPQGYRMEATLSGEQLLAVAQNEKVMFIDRWSPPEADMDVARSTGGANFIETTLGFTGQGVRAEVMDGGLRTTHTDFQSGLVPIIHGSSAIDSHGTATYGINFGRGTTNPQGRGMLPDAQGIIARYQTLTNRYTHTAELLQNPYRAVYQSNSWGSTQTTAYTTISAEMDDILFINDFCLLNSQSNTGNQNSRPQAWAKNVVSVGGISHMNTAGFNDDRWTSASVGPASDGRLKPELAHFYDNIFTTTSTNDTAYTSGFGGTSGATPITAGHFGIFYQMWHQDVFGQTSGSTVFDARPHFTTAKAVMINTAIQWDMTIPGTNTTRVRQGFGRVDLTNLYNLRNKMLIINETDVLTNLQTKTYNVTVPAGSTDPLKVTMTYNDPMGSPTAMRHRINDLTLKVTAPNGDIYWGNNGLGVGGGMWSTSGGSANVVDTVENVFIQTPQAGNWTVEVIASEVVTDARTETPGVIDVDYALVVSGIQRQNLRNPFDYDGDGKADVSVFRPADGVWHLLRSTSGYTAFPFGTTGDRIVPGDYDGDDKTDAAVFRAGNWYLLRSSLGFTALPFGFSTDTPVPADYDGDGLTDIAVFRNGVWYIQGSTSGFSATSWGFSSDLPVPGYFDSDSRADIAVFRPSNGTWYLLRSTAGFAAFPFGTSGDRPVVGDYDGDGLDDPSVYRAGTWYMLQSYLGFGAVSFGISTDTPVPADYDGDGKTDQAVYRSGTWYLLRSQSGFNAVPFGTSTDIPTESAYIP